jgi:hypothetical protein
MPIPRPRDGEAESDFIGRCMRALSTEFPKNEVRAGVCYTSWREHHGKTAAQDAIKAALAQPLSFDELLKRGLA